MIYLALVLCAVNLYVTVVYFMKLKERIEYIDKQRKWYEIVEDIKVKGANVTYEQIIDKRIL